MIVQISVDVDPGSQNEARIGGPSGVEVVHLTGLSLETVLVAYFCPGEREAEL